MVAVRPDGQICRLDLAMVKNPDAEGLKVR
jgi:hypothetical protein